MKLIDTCKAEAGPQVDGLTCQDNSTAPFSGEQVEQLRKVMYFVLTFPLQVILQNRYAVG